LQHSFYCSWNNPAMKYFRACCNSSARTCKTVAAFLFYFILFYCRRLRYVFIPGRAYVLLLNSVHRFGWQTQRKIKLGTFFEAPCICCFDFLTFSLAVLNWKVSLNWLCWLQCKFIHSNNNNDNRHNNNNIYIQVCNNLGQCHCDDGYAPPNCATAGPGGSLHSGPANPSSNTGQ